LLWLKQEYLALNYEVSTHSYKSGANFIAERQGSDPSKYLIVSAHLDNVGNAGADDDGAGTISALAIAHALKDYNLKYNLRVVGFDQEERGLVGSSNYARHLNQTGGFDGLIGVVNIEMTGYDGDADGGFHVIDCDENSSSDLTEVMEAAIEANNYDLEKVRACTNRSDHASFWRYNQPAIVIAQNFFGGDSNPCYHRSCDQVDRINFDYMAELTAATASTVANLVEANE